MRTPVVPVSGTISANVSKHVHTPSAAADELIEQLLALECPKFSPICGANRHVIKPSLTHGVPKVGL